MKESDKKNWENEEKSVRSAINCADPSLDFEKDPLLTPAEKIALLNVALLRSLNKYDASQTVGPTTPYASVSGGAIGEGWWRQELFEPNGEHRIL